MTRAGQRIFRVALLTCIAVGVVTLLLLPPVHGI